MNNRLTTSRTRTIKEYTDQLCHFVSSPHIKQIVEGIHVNDALIYDAWGALPEPWTTWLSAWPDYRQAQENLISSSYSEDLVTNNISNSRPESLNQWLGDIKSLTLDRSQDEGVDVELPETLTSRMKPKKIEEVSRAAAYIYNICKIHEIRHIVEMGSGQGYLSISLAYLYPDLQILSIDGSEAQIAGARSCAESLGISETQIDHRVQYIDGSQDLSAKIETWANGSKCIITGLHACGNLSEHMLRYFTTTPCVQAIAVIGCCYHHIIPRSSEHPTGFPISLKLREQQVKLGPRALMAAGQTPNNWKSQNTTASVSTFGKRRLYRAILEKVFFDKGIKPKIKQSWGIRQGDLVSFGKFSERAMDCLNIDSSVISVDELESYYERYKHYQGRISILWTLGILCGGVIESLIAVDRYWYLVESGAEDVDVVPIFDYRVSPRNLMIVGYNSIRAG